MNITRYQGKKGDKIVHCGSITLKKGYCVASGDEYAYEFLGKNSCYPFYEIVHPDDRDEFIDAIEKLKDGMQAIIVRVKCCNNTYRCLYMLIQHDDMIYDGFHFITLYFNDIMEIKKKYDKSTTNIEKYREFLSLSSLTYFEYHVGTNILEIYRYMKGKSFPVFKEDLDDMRVRINHNSLLSYEIMVEFDVFYDYLKDGAESFETIISDVIFEDKVRLKKFRVKGSTLCKDDKKNLVVGIMRPAGKVKSEETYYLTDAARDVGTGLLNKRAINEYVMERIEKHSSMYVVIMDIDDFKKINDTYGHMQGDTVLLKIAEVIRSVAKSRCTAGRFGGDEFFLVLENVESEASLRIILKTMCKHIQWIYQREINGLQVTTSMGIAKYPEDGSNYEELFRKADKALYIAKAKGKNRFIIYNEKKHGAIELLDDNERVIGINAVVDNDKRVGAISKIVTLLHNNGKEYLMVALDTLRKYFDVDGITVYEGFQLKKGYSTGNYVNQIERFSYLDEAYLSKFNENGVYKQTNVHKMETRFKKMYQALIRQGTAEFIHYISYKDNKPAVFVTFDVFDRSRKWSEMDVSLMTIVSSMISDILIEEVC